MDLIINIDNGEYRKIHPYNITDLEITESKRFCSQYKDGILPGMKEYSERYQYAHIKSLRNLVEYNKITTTETIEKSNYKYISTRFFDNRRKGWELSKYSPKTDDIVAYYASGFLFPLRMKDTFYKNILLGIYKSRSRQCKILKALKEKSKNMNVIIVRNVKNNDDPLISYFLDILPEILKDDFGLPNLLL